MTVAAFTFSRSSVPAGSVGAAAIPAADPLRGADTELPSVKIVEGVTATRGADPFDGTAICASLYSSGAQLLAARAGAVASGGAQEEGDEGAAEESAA